MTTMTRDQAIEIQKKFAENLRKFAAENGLNLHKNDLQWGADGGLKFTVNLSSQDANPDAVDPRYKRDLQSRGWQHGLEVGMIGTKVQVGGKIGTIEFLGMRASKVVVKAEDGKVYLYNAEQLSPRIVLAAKK